MRISPLTLVPAMLAALICLSCGTDGRTGAASGIDTETSMDISGGISNQRVNCFFEDGFGQIWMGTFRGLNKYYGREYGRYYHTSDDSLSLVDSQIRSVFEDSKGRIWICCAGGVSLYRDDDSFENIPLDNAYDDSCIEMVETDGGLFLNCVTNLYRLDENERIFRTVIDDFDTDRQYNLKIMRDPSGDLWAVGPLSIRRFDGKTAELKGSWPTGGYTLCRYMDSGGILWLCDYNSVRFFNTHTCTLSDAHRTVAEHPVLSKAYINFISPYKKNALLINTQVNGLYIYYPATGTIVGQDGNGFPFEVPKLRISCIFTDSRDNVWFGSQDQGYAVSYSYKSVFNSNIDVSSTFKGKSVISIDEGAGDDVWVCTSNDGIFRLSGSGPGSIRRFATDDLLNPNKYHKTSITGAFADSRGNVWLSSFSGTAKCGVEGDDLEVKEYYPVITTCFAEDGGGDVWAGGPTGVIKLKKGADGADPQQVNLFKDGYCFVNSITSLPDGRLLVLAFSRNPVIFDPVGGDKEELDLLSAFTDGETVVPTGSYMDGEGRIWVGTVGKGLWRYDKAEGRFTRMAGLSCNDICDIIGDRQGHVWVSTGNGLTKYDRTVDRFTNYYESDGIGGNQFNERAACLLKDGMVLFGGTHGLTYFNPVDIRSAKNFKVIFKNLEVEGKLIRPYEHPEIISKSLAYNPDIHLRYDRNSFSVSFAAIDYGEFERVRYLYRLEGSDKDWTDSRSGHVARYSNLRPGKYTFKVKVMNYDLTDEEGSASINVRISRAPWLSWWALLLYAAAAVCIVIFFVNARIHLMRSRARSRKLEEEREQEKKVNRMNLDFFANISHEFRTPLTMIAGPVDQLITDERIPGDDRKLLLIIQRAVQRMLRLVNQILDFNKLDNDTLRLETSPVDVAGLLSHDAEVFGFNTANKGIAFATAGLDEPVTALVDADKVEKIFGNLMANALKFTKPGGKITVRFDVVPDKEAAGEFAAEFASAGGKGGRWSGWFRLEVENSGTHIPEEQLEKIFQRFYQLDNDKGVYNYGTGIGLYFCRRLATLHHGFIHARNTAEGVAFTLIIPDDERAYPESERASAVTQVQGEAFPLMPKEEAAPAGEEGQDNTRTILVVDDDTEVAVYLDTLLSPHYKVICRYDADSAFRAAHEEMPDLILSDVIMPGKNGYEFCREIKADPDICHIPVILVTAKATVENQIEGLHTGADAYVTKPFEPSYLLALIQSQLSNRDRVRSILGSATKADKIGDDVLTPNDKAFMSSLYDLMESEISNPELNVAKITEMMRISRTKFYYKVKGLTGMNPNVFFKTYRLNRSAELLREGKYNISEIADLTGFSTLSHFSSSFKKQFGVAPSEFRG